MHLTTFHPLKTAFSLPKQLNNPFYYHAHPLCIEAWKHICKAIESNSLWHEEAQKGKMFGVLIVQDATQQVGFLAAYSGQINGTYPTTFFIPPIFNYLSINGYFKTNEKKISEINHQINTLSSSESFLLAQKEIELCQKEQETILKAHKQKMVEAKVLRDKKRTLNLNQEEKEALLNESRTLKAQLKRLKVYYTERLQALNTQIKTHNEQIEALKKQRKNMSDALQRWLFNKFVLCNSGGEQKSVLSIFEEQTNKMPPAGTGECCAPKLLHYAFKHQLKPLAMAEFWYGASPKGKIRQHGNTYPACKDKCMPLLAYLLKDFPHDINPLELPKKGEIAFLYEDEHLAVITKPSGLPSVKGLFKGDSVETLLKKHYPLISSPFIVHRLDMDTSGIMLIAKTKKTYVALQQQFEKRHIKKRYIALLEGILKNKKRKGEITLALRPDYEDRPKQMVDVLNGKPAFTQYEIVGNNLNHTRIALYPQTGRTHQLRVHCAHQEGLGLAIKGDKLYGNSCGRLCLHAEAISFEHPITKQLMMFESKAPF